MLYVWLVQPWPLIFQSMLWMKCSQSMTIKIIFSPDLKILVCRHPTESTGNVRVKQLFSRSFLKKFFFNHKYFVLAKFSLESKVNFLFFLLHPFLIVHIVLFILFTLSSVQVSLDCATLMFSMFKCTLYVWSGNDFW